MIENQRNLCRFPFPNNAILSPPKIKLILTDFLVKRKSRSVKKSLADIIIVQHLIYFKHLLIQSINQENVIHPLSLKFKILPTLMLPQNFEIISNSPISSSPIKVNRNRGGAFYVSGTSKNLPFNSYVSWTLSSCQDHHVLRKSTHDKFHYFSRAFIDQSQSSTSSRTKSDCFKSTSFLQVYAI